MFFICILNGLQAILEYRQQLGKHVNHRGRTEFVGALFVHTICDHPLKSLLIYCGCLFSEDPSLSLGTASILISQLGLSCFCKEKAICKMKRRQIKHGNVRTYWDRNAGGVGRGGGGSRQILHWIRSSSDIFAIWHALRSVRKHSQELKAFMKMMEMHLSFIWYSTLCA